MVDGQTVGTEIGQTFSVHFFIDRLHSALAGVNRENLDQCAIHTSVMMYDTAVDANIYSIKH
jgi:hypothetical protein